MAKIELVLLTSEHKPSSGRHAEPGNARRVGLHDPLRPQPILSSGIAVVDISLDRVVAFNRELAALSAAGLPAALDLGNRHQEIASKLSQINSSLALRAKLGQPVEQAIADDVSLPPRYRAGLLSWLGCEHPQTMMDAITRPAITNRDITHQVKLMLFQLLILSVLAFVAIVSLCVWTNPGVDAIYTQLERTPNEISLLLTAARSWLPVWGLVLPVLFVGAMLLWRWRAQSIDWQRLPGVSTYLASVRNADFALQLAELLENKHSLEASLPLVATVSANMPMDLTTMLDSGETQVDVNPARVSLAIDRLPSIFRWALMDNSHHESKASALRFAAASYRLLAERQRRRWIVVAPAIFGILIGGLVVMGYGLSVFLPVIGLLRDVALAGS